MEIVPTCRACLRPSLSYIDLETPFEQNVIGISLEIQPDAYTTFMDCFRICTKLKVADCEEKMPQRICEQCGFELGIAWNFLQKALHSDQILRDTVGSLKTNTVFVENDSVDRTQVTVAAEEMVNETIDEGVDQENLKEVYENESNAKDVIISNKFENADYCIKLDEGEHVSTKRSLDYPQNDGNKNITTMIRKNSSSNLIGDDYYVLEVLDADINKESKPKKISNKFELEDDNNTDRTVAVANETEPIETTYMYNCPASFQTFESRGTLPHHSRTHTLNAVKVIICKLCDQKITKEETMRKHLKNVHSNIIDCSQCDYRCPAFKMSDHVHRTHVEPRNFACNICDKTFVSQSILNSHIKYHQRKEANIKSDACETCGKRFSTQHYLRLHMDVHRNERQLHQCDYCDKMYVSKIAFENHIRLHRGETIKCDQCGKEFVRQYELNVHMRFHTRDYPFKCEVCDKKFAIKGHLRTHMWRHQGLKLQCEECGKLFTSTKALQEHSFVHSEMPFPCTYCGRGYPSKQKFKVHLKTTHLIELTEDELLKITKLQTPKPLQRKKLTLVQADSVMKEIEVKDGEGETLNEGDLFIELC